MPKKKRPKYPCDKCNAGSHDAFKGNSGRQFMFKFCDQCSAIINEKIDSGEIDPKLVSDFDKEGKIEGYHDDMAQS